MKGPKCAVEKVCTACEPEKASIWLLTSIKVSLITGRKGNSTFHRCLAFSLIDLKGDVKACYPQEDVDVDVDAGDRVLKLIPPQKSRQSS